MRAQRSILIPKAVKVIVQSESCHPTCQIFCLRHRSTGLLARIVGVTVLQPRLALVTSPPTNPSRLHKSYSFLSSLAFSFQNGFVTRNWHRPATLLCHGVAQSTHSRATLGLMTLVESTALFNFLSNKKPLCGFCSCLYWHTWLKTLTLTQKLPSG